MAFDVSAFAAAGLPLGGARSSLFTVIIDTPSGVPNIGARCSFTCSAAKLPASSIDAKPISYFGREIKLKGQRKYDNWTVTVLNDEDFQVRHAMELWSNEINRAQTNLTAAQLATTASYRTTAQVTQYSKTGIPIRTYEFANLWPVKVGEIDMDWSKEDIETFTVEFAYDYWTLVAPGTTGTLPL